MRLLLGLAVLAFSAITHAQPYPARPVTILIGFPPGGTTDGMVRTVAERLSARLGQPVLVENRPGATGMIAAASVAKAAPDGYTILFGVAANLAVGPATQKKPPYDPSTAFTPIVEISRGAYIWLVRADHPAADMKQFIAWTRANPGKANFASPGHGSVHHLAAEMLKQRTGATMTHVPYKGGAALGAALLGGEVQGMFESPGVHVGNIRAGKLRALAVTGEKRLAVLPQVPTLKEQGLPDVEANSWWGLVGPAGLPADVVRRLNAETSRLLGEPELKEVLAKLSVEPTPATPEAFAAYIREEWMRWRQFIATSGLVLDQ